MAFYFLMQICNDVKRLNFVVICCSCVFPRLLDGFWLGRGISITFNRMFGFLGQFHMW